MCIRDRHDGPHRPPHAGGKGLRHPPRRGEGASVFAGGDARVGRQERALARARQDLQRLAGDVADAAGERPRAERNRHPPSAKAARRAPIQIQGGALMLLTWMAYATLVSALLLAGAHALNALALQRRVATRFIWLATLLAAVVVPTAIGLRRSAPVAILSLIHISEPT